MSKIKVMVSDHAVLRYVERAMGVDVEKIRREIEKQAMAAAALGASRINVNGLRYCLSAPRLGGFVAVTTALKPSMGKRPPSRK